MTLFRKLARSLSLLPLFALAVACGSEAAIGEACSTTGSVDECASGAICVANGAASPRCLQVCTESSQCAATDECNGVEGSSTKACRPRDAKSK